MKVKTRRVITIDGLLTEEEFTHSLETTATVALWNENLICWYEKGNYTKLKGIRGQVLSFKRTFIIEKSGKKAVYSLDGYEILPFGKYKYVNEQCYAIEVEIDDNNGAYSYDGKLIVPIKYDKLSFSEEGIYSIYGFVKKGLYSYDGKVIISDDYTICNTIDSGMLCQSNNQKYGIYSSDGDIIVPFEYDSLAVYKKCILAEKDKRCGMLSNTGEILVPFEYQDIKPVSNDNNDYFIARKENYFGYALYKYTGKEILAPVYSDIRYEKNCVITFKDGYYGLYRVDGLELLKPIYEDIRLDNHDIFWVRTVGAEFYYISSLNKRIHADDVSCHSGMYLSLNNGVWTKIDESRIYA